MAGKTLRKIGIGFGIAAGAVGAGCAEDVAVADIAAEMEELAQPQETKWEEDSFEARTEKEFRKHDPWALRAFKTSQDSTAPVRIAKYAPAFDPKERNVDTRVHNLGMYSRKEILFLYPNEGTFGAIDHEAFHAFRDLVGLKGKIGCLKPASKDISAYCEAQRSLPAFEDLEKKADIWAKTKMEYARLKMLMEQHETYHDFVEESNLIVELYNREKIDEGDFIYYEGDFAFKMLRTIRQSARTKLIGNRNVFQPTVEELDKFYSILKKNVDEVEKQLAFFREGALEFADDYLTSKVAKRLKEDFSEVQECPFYEMCLDLEDFQVSERKRAYEDVLSDEELLARAFDGLASIYLGPAEVNMIPITPESIALFEQYKWLDGTHVFRKLIERGKVALQMQEDGVNPEEIKRQLEYAESFTYRNVTYDWRNIDFRLEEQIPLLERNGQK
jgi:hypothetical protein